MSVKAWAMPMESREKLIKAAIEAKEGSYSPYSKFRVGAALLTPSGEIIKGANIENASYGGTICAERTAIVKAASEGKRGFIGLAVTTDVKAAISPCGICRQVIREFCALDMPVLLVPADYPQTSKPNEPIKPGYSADGVRETTLGELLPDSFGPEDLELPRS
ncbi:cytidine deaminase-like protein [Panaeolus papilionaceus]|nr:cytidine deaminase-like protein [Panaeolus papilionaceus]